MLCHHQTPKLYVLSTQHLAPSTSHLHRHAALIFVATLLGLASAACNLYPGVPATPTLIPTYETPTPTAQIATQVLLLPSPSLTPSATRTPTDLPPATPTTTTAPSLTLTATPTLPPSLTVTPSATLTATITPVIATATLTAPPPTLTVTPRPTDTPTATSTATQPPSATASFTLVPSLTLPPPTATTTATPPASRTAQQVAITVTNPPTIASVPTSAPQPVTFTPLPVAIVASQTLRPTASQPPATLERPVIVITSTPRPQLTATSGTPIAVPGVTPTPISVAVVPTFETLPNGQTRIADSVLQPPPRDAQGQVVLDYDIKDGLQVIINAAGQAIINGSPYVGDDKHTRQRFIMARWSPDGRYLAYIVQREGAQSGNLDFLTTIDDGVWVVDSALGSKPRHIFLNTYIRDSNDYPYRVAVGLSWANDNGTLLITVDTVAGLSTVLAGIYDPPEKAQTFPTAPGTWLLDSSGWVATRAENGTVTLGVNDRNGPFTLLLNSLQAGVWIQNPAQIADGQYAFLGKPSLSGRLDGGATDLRLYLYISGQPPYPVSEPLSGEVLTAEWSPNRQALLVHLRTADGGIAVKVITLNGAIADYTTAANGNSGTHWLR
ncbi:MAG: PD40 domain-containing protein [Anaerolineae bacterium]|nr:PD40 domain-containing protein [Anaerolineae bacterium]